MTAITYNISIDQTIHDQASPILENYGLTASQAFRLFLNQIAKTKTIPISFDWEKHHDQTTEQTANTTNATLDFSNATLESLSGIRPFTGGKHIVTNDIVNQIREQKGI